MKFSRVEDSSSSSETCSPWCVKPLACSKESSTKAERRWYRSSGCSSAARCMSEKSINCVPVTWNPKCCQIVRQMNSREVWVLHQGTARKWWGSNWRFDLTSVQERWPFEELLGISWVERHHCFGALWVDAITHNVELRNVLSQRRMRCFGPRGRGVKWLSSEKMKLGQNRTLPPRQ